MDCSKMDKNSWLLTWVLFWAGVFLAVLTLLTRGPKWPWVAHLKKRSKVTVEPFTEDH